MLTWAVICICLATDSLHTLSKDAVTTLLYVSTGGDILGGIVACCALGRWL